jgi:uncharacterized phiE125 gp8 family phage protein
VEVRAHAMAGNNRRISMMLIEQTTIPGSALPVQVFKDHLRLGTGFADEGTQDGLVESYLRAAVAAIEGRIGKALLTRRFAWTISNWRDEVAQSLPVAPVSAIVSVTLISRDGTPASVDPARYGLVTDMHRPKLVAAGLVLPSIPVAGQAQIVFDAGFGAQWSDIPADLAQGVLLLAAEYYERRDEFGLRDGGMPFGVMSLIERWRTVRVLGGGST